MRGIISITNNNILNRIKCNEYMFDFLAVFLILSPSFPYAIPWLLDPNPSLGVDHYGGGSILIGKSFEVVHKGYITDWYIGANFALYPVRYIYWILINLLIFITKNHIFAIKLSFYLTFVLCVITSYFVIKKIWKNSASGILGSLFYSYTPYHMAWMGTEAIWSLSFFYALLPIAFYCLLEYSSKVLNNKVTKRELLTFSLALIIVSFTHPQSFIILTFPFFILFVLICFVLYYIRIKKTRSELEITKKLAYLILPFIVTLIISAVWWIPAIISKNLLTEPMNTLEVVKKKTPPAISIMLLQGRAWSVPSFKYLFYDPTEISLAVVTVILLYLSIIFCIKSSNQETWIISLVVTSLFFFLLAMGPLSPIPIYNFFYDNIPFFSNFRTPGRFLVDILLAFSILFPKGVIELINSTNNLSKIKFRGALYILVCIIIILNSATELRYAFETFDLKQDIFEYYKFFSNNNSSVRILTLPPMEFYLLSDASLNKTPLERLKWIRDPRLWTFMYGHHEHILGGSASLSVKELHSFINSLKAIIRTFNSNITTILNVYGINYIWIDKQKIKEISTGRCNYLDNNTIKVLETENYVLYKNTDAFPKMFLVCEAEQNLSGSWKLAEGNGNLKIIKQESDFIKITVNFTRKNVREWRYIKYLSELDNLSTLDELYFEYELLNIPPKSVDIRIKFADENGNHYIWIYKLDELHGTVRIPLFWLQPIDENVTKVDVGKFRVLKIGIIEAYNDIDSQKIGEVIVRNIKILKHNKCGDVSYEKVNSVRFKITDIQINSSRRNKCDKLVLVLNYAYNPRFHLLLETNDIQPFKIFGFINGFKLGIDDVESLRKIIEKRGYVDITMV